MPEMIAVAEPTTRQCPQCQNIIPVDRRYVTWCERCGWNVNPLEDKTNPGAFEKVYVLLGKRSGAALFHELENKTPKRQRLAVSKILGYGVATTVHFWTFLWLCLGLFVLTGVRNSIFALLPAAFFLSIVWLTRPRLGKLPKDIAPREQYPALYGLIDRITDQLHTSKVDGVVLDWQFNASMSQVTLRRKKIITLGLPLFTILSPQERVALLAHEVAHSVNGDSARGIYIGGAINTLNEWYGLLVPTGKVTLIALVMYAVSRLPWLGFYTLSYLLWWNRQRAEYLADYLAAQVSGTAAAVGLTDKLHFNGLFSSAARRVTLNTNLDFFAELNKAVAELAPRELERIRRVEQLEGVRLDATHPPTVYRLAMLKAHPADVPEVVCGQDEANRIDQECVSARQQIQKQITTRYLGSLYY